MSLHWKLNKLIRLQRTLHQGLQVLYHILFYEKSSQDSQSKQLKLAAETFQHSCKKYFKTLKKTFKKTVKRLSKQKN